MSVQRPEIAREASKYVMPVDIGLRVRARASVVQGRLAKMIAVCVHLVENNVEMHVLMFLLTGYIAGNATMSARNRICVCKGHVSRLVHPINLCNVKARVSPLIRTPNTVGHAVWYAGRGRLVCLGHALVHLDKQSVVDHVST